MPLTLWNMMRTRSLASELMDLESCNRALLERTVRQFAVFNRFFSASRGLIARCFFDIMDKNRSSAYSLIDLGAGGCDIDVWAAEEARKRGISLSITAVDRDERVLSVAREATAEFPEISIVKADVRDPSTFDEFDFIFCNNFLHHLSWKEIGAMLKTIERRTKIAFLLNDLRRSAWAYVGYSIFTALFLKPSLAFTDGRLSILRGFQKTELSALLTKHLPAIPVEIIRAFPARLALYRRKI
jgi:2-polyprenyl-3-methyl-5-hydroxy-6-metoxy-1,4-benzoquinol methylase